MQAVFLCYGPKGMGRSRSEKEMGEVGFLTGDGPGKPSCREVRELAPDGQLVVPQLVTSITVTLKGDYKKSEESSLTFLRLFLSKR